MCDPSKGGIGTKLNIPKRKLKKEMKLKGAKRFKGKEKNLIKSAKVIPSNKLVNDPAVATANSPHFLLRKFKGLTGTGFADPRGKPKII